MKKRIEEIELLVVIAIIAILAGMMNCFLPLMTMERPSRFTVI
jgi:prepilin-type N-terminal cleavage/methylation domain-containing protein